MTDRPELLRRRALLLQSIGSAVQLKREALKPNDLLCGQHGQLTHVRRTKVTVDFGDEGVWDIPIYQVLLPHSVEADPRQRELFSEGGAL